MKKNLLLSIIALTICAVTMAQSKFKPITNSDEFTTKLVSLMKNMNTMQSEFSQVKHISGMASDLKSSGMFYYSKADKVCLDYSTPIKNTIIVNGSKLKINKNVIDASSNPLISEMVSVISSCMTGNIQNLSDKYKLEYYQNSTEYLIKVFPLNESAKKFISEVNINIRKSDMSILGMKMIEAKKNGNSSNDNDFTQYLFSKTKLNEAIDASKFNIK